MNILKHYLLSNVSRNIPDEQGNGEQVENNEQNNQGQQEAAAEEQSGEQTEKPEGEVAAGATDAETVADTAAAQSDEEINDWREKQIAKQHKRIQQEKAGRERAEQQLAEVLANRQPTAKVEGETERTAPAAALSEDEVNRRATAIAEQSRFTERLTALNEQGEKTHGKDWNTALNRLTQIGDGTMPDLPWIMNALPEQAAKLLVDLGKNPAEMLRISELPVERRQAEYFKKAMTTAPTTKKVSSAPAPVEKVASRATVPAGQLRDDMSDEAWSAVRGAQRKARWEQQQRR